VKSILYRFVDIFNGIKYLVSKKESSEIKTEVKTTEPANRKIIMTGEGLFEV
jgi:hypothetical protein